MSFVRRVLLGDGGWGAFAGTALLFGAGFGLVWLGVSDIREAVRLRPVKQTCQDFLAAPGTEARWVSLSGCRLDLQGAATRRWKGWFSRPDAGDRSRTLELFIPLSALGTTAPEVPNVVVASREPALLELVDTLQRLPVDKVDAFVDEHAKALEATLAPEQLDGYVEPIASSASRTALSVMTAQDAVVLEQGRTPERSNALCSLLLGLAAMVWSLLSVARRWTLAREESNAARPPSS